MPRGPVGVVDARLAVGVVGVSLQHGPVRPGKGGHIEITIRQVIHPLLHAAGGGAQAARRRVAVGVAIAQHRRVNVPQRPNVLLKCGGRAVLADFKQLPGDIIVIIVIPAVKAFADAAVQAVIFIIGLVVLATVLIPGQPVPCVVGEEIGGLGRVERLDVAGGVVTPE